MNVLDLFAGLEGWSAPWRDRGHNVYSVDLDERFDVDLHADIAELRAADLPWRPDVILASPPCEALSVLKIGTNWTGPNDYPPHQPKTDAARLAVRLVAATRRLIADARPAYFVIENPRAKLRKLPVVADLERRTVTYCHLGEPFAKPTDLWGGFPPSLNLPAECRCRGPLVERDGMVWQADDAGRPCHLSAPRGSTTSIQGDLALFDAAVTAKAAYDAEVRASLNGSRFTRAKRNGDKPSLAARRAKVPAALSLMVCLAAEADLPTGVTGSAALRLF